MTKRKPKANDGKARPRFTDIRLFIDNDEAWQAKRNLIASARKSLDLAYFIVEIDGSTSCLLVDLVAAARRGVKVRLLVDYFMTVEQVPALRALARIPNIEVRRFHPPAPQWLQALEAAKIDAALFIRGLATTDMAMLAQALRSNTILPAKWVKRLHELHAASAGNGVGLAMHAAALLHESVQEKLSRMDPAAKARLVATEVPRLRGRWRRARDVLVGFDTFLHRTHHKLLLADRERFIMGGRNLADAYHCSAPPCGRPFVDADVLVHDASFGAQEHVAAFKTLWSGSLAQDAALPDRLDDRPAMELSTIEALACGHKAGSTHCARASHDLPDMDGEIVNNLPGAKGDPAITRLYARCIKRAEKRGGSGGIDIANAYVCPSHGNGGSPTLRRLTDSLLSAARAGLPVHLRTNSMETTDLKPVNRAAYPMLRDLIKAGVQVWELDNEQGSLHAKVARIGADRVVVGSFNFDPRSELYDTNNAIVFHDRSGEAGKALAAALLSNVRWSPLTKEDVKRRIENDGSPALWFGRVRRVL